MSFRSETLPDPMSSPLGHLPSRRESEASSLAATVKQQQRQMASLEQQLELSDVERRADRDAADAKLRAMSERFDALEATLEATRNSAAKATVVSDAASRASNESDRQLQQLHDRVHTISAAVNNVEERMSAHSEALAVRAADSTLIHGRLGEIKDAVSAAAAAATQQAHATFKRDQAEYHAARSRADGYPMSPTERDAHSLVGTRDGIHSPSIAAPHDDPRDGDHGGRNGVAWAKRPASFGDVAVCRQRIDDLYMLFDIPLVRAQEAAAGTKGDRLRLLHSTPPFHTLWLELFRITDAVRKGRVPSMDNGATVADLSHRSTDEFLAGNASDGFLASVGSPQYQQQQQQQQQHQSWQGQDLNGRVSPSVTQRRVTPLRSSAAGPTVSPGVGAATVSNPTPNTPPPHGSSVVRSLLEKEAGAATKAPGIGTDGRTGTPTRHLAQDLQNALLGEGTRLVSLSPTDAGATPMQASDLNAISADVHHKSHLHPASTLPPAGSPLSYYRGDEASALQQMSRLGGPMPGHGTIGGGGGRASTDGRHGAGTPPPSHGTAFVSSLGVDAAPAVTAPEIRDAIRRLRAESQVLGTAGGTPGQNPDGGYPDSPHIAGRQAKVLLDTAPVGATIHRVPRGSLLDRYGVSGGDVVVAVEGQTVYSAEDIEACLQGRPQRSKVTLSVQPRGRSGSVPLLILLS